MSTSSTTAWVRTSALTVAMADAAAGRPATIEIHDLAQRSAGRPDMRQEVVLARGADGRELQRLLRVEEAVIDKPRPRVVQRREVLVPSRAAVQLVGIQEVERRHDGRPVPVVLMFDLVHW